MALPITRGSSVPLYPYRKTIRTSTVRNVFENAFEQRFVYRPPLVDFSLPYGFLTSSQTQALRGAHTSAKGRLDDTLSLVLEGTTYTNLAFMDDKFTAREHTNTIYGTQIDLRQTVPQALASDANGNVFPPTVLTQLPFTRIRESKTYVADQKSGPRYGYGLWGTSLAGFPTRQLIRWILQFDTLFDAQRVMLEKFFIAMNGRYGKFSYTDPEDNTTYGNVSMDQDDLEIECIAPNVGRLTLALAEHVN